MNEVEAKSSFCRADNMIFAINQNEKNAGKRDGIRFIFEFLRFFSFLRLRVLSVKMYVWDRVERVRLPLVKMEWMIWVRVETKCRFDFTINFPSLFAFSSCRATFLELDNLFNECEPKIWVSFSKMVKIPLSFGDSKFPKFWLFRSHP